MCSRADGQEAQWLVKHGGFRPAGARAAVLHLSRKEFQRKSGVRRPSSKQNVCLHLKKNVFKKAVYHRNGE
jgi:hypothetical protein